MEFDSEEEREIFGMTDEEDHNMESDYSSREEDIELVNTRGAEQDVELISPEDFNSGLSPSGSLRPQDGRLPDEREVSDEGSDENEEEQETELERHVSRPRLFSSKSTTPTFSNPPDDTREEFFSEDIIDHASSFISTTSINRTNRDRATTGIKTSPRQSSVGLFPIDKDTDLIPAADEIGLPSSLFNPISSEDTPPSSPETIDVDVISPDQSVNSRASTPPLLYQDVEPREVVRPKLTPSSGGGRKKVSKNNRRRCEECEACLNEVDCRKCRFCLDMKKYGGLGRLRQKCIKRQCLRLSRIINVQNLSHIQDQFKLNSAGTEIDEKGGVSSLNSISGSSKMGGVIPANAPPTSQITQSPNTQPFYITGTTVTAPVPATKSSKKPPAKKPSTKRSSQQKKRSVKRTRPIDINYSSDSDPEVIYKPSTRQRRPLSEMFDSWSTIPHEEPTKTQCLGPGCVYAARPHSKYCSEECGVQLAMK